MSKKFFFSAYIAPETPTVEDVTNNVQPTITLSDYSSLSGSHVGSQYQVATDSEFTDIVYDSGETTDLLEHTIDTLLDDSGVTHYARGRQKNDFRMGIWSDWSSPASFSATEPSGHEIFSSPGTHAFTAPWGVDLVHAVCIGAGAGGESGWGDAGEGGGLGWKNNIPVTPGNTYTVKVGEGGTGGETGWEGDGVDTSATDGGDSSFEGCVGGGGVVGGNSGGSFTGDGGGKGGYGKHGGGGAGGYSGDGGDGGWVDGSGYDGTGGGSGGGGGGHDPDADDGSNGGNGGETGIYGEGASGDGGSAGSSNTSGGDGEDGSSSSSKGGSGGGAGMEVYDSDKYETWYGGGSDGTNGIVRIIWGPGKSFPDNAS